MSDCDCPRCDKYISDLFEHFLHIPLGETVSFECPHCDAPIDGFSEVTYCLTDTDPPKVEDL